MSDRLHVVAGVLRDTHGNILLAQRPAGKHLAGLWEFPGGKCEPGEDPRAALRRELHEELGIDIGAADALIAIPWRYADKYIYLDVYTVRDYAGAPHGREGQALRWIAAADLSQIAMPPADRPVVAALRLPRQYAITVEPIDDREFLESLQRLLCDGLSMPIQAVPIQSTPIQSAMIQLRSKQRDSARLRTLALAARDMARARGCTLLLNDHFDLVEELDLDGVHLSAARARQCRTRPLPAQRWVGASCHDAHELMHAAALGVDFAVLGPVKATRSHPAAIALGWARFAELCAEAPFPVYALGGLERTDLDAALAAGAQGIAGISAFWPD